MRKNLIKTSLTILVLVILSASLLISAAAEDSVKVVDGFRIYGGKVTSYSGNSVHVVIPDGVTEIYREAFRLNKTMRSVTVPNSVKIIDSEAFMQSYVETVRIGSGVKYIAGDAFRQCELLKEFIVDPANPVFYSIDGALYNRATQTLIWHPAKKEPFSLTIPEGIIRIESGAFAGCKGLTRITLPQSLEHIGSSAFRECINLEEIELPNKVAYIGTFAFDSCKKLKKVNIPASVSIINLPVFRANESLEEISVDPRNKHYSSKDGVLFNKSGTTLIQYPAGNLREMYQIPAGVLHIGQSAFNNSIYEARHMYGYPNVYGYYKNHKAPLKKVVFPEGLLSIDSFAFAYSNLESIILPDSLKYIGTETFYDALSYNTGAIDLILPKNLDFMWGGAFKACKFNEVTVLSPNVEFRGTMSMPLIFDASVKLNGYAGSTAEEYAKKNNVKFGLIPTPAGTVFKKTENEADKEQTISNANENSDIIYDKKSRSISFPDGIVDLQVGIDIYNEKYLDTETIIIPPSVKYINSTFEGLPNLKTIVIPENVIYVQNNLASIVKKPNRNLHIRILNPNAYLEKKMVSNEILNWGDSTYTYIPFVIEGYEGSSAQVYAEVNKGVKFVSLGKPKTPEISAVPSLFHISTAGKGVSVEAYTIKGDVYFKLRDIAELLRDTPKQFDVVWDSSQKALKLLPNTPYSAVSSVIEPGDGLNKVAVPNTLKLLLPAGVINTNAYNIEGNNYLLLKDIANIAGIKVTPDIKPNSLKIDTDMLDVNP